VTGLRWEWAFGRRIAAEGVFVATIAGAIAFVVDGACVEVGRASVATGLACGLASASLIVLVTLALSPVLAAMTWLLDRLGRGPPVMRALGPIVVAACSAAVAVEMAPALRVGEKHHAHHYSEILVSMFSVTVPFLAACARGDRKMARFAAGTIALACLAGDLAWPRVQYSDAHDLAGILLVAATAAALAPLLARVRAWRHVARVFVGSIAIASGTAMLVEPLRPGWRVSAAHYALFEPPVAELLRHVADLDRDGYSTIGWGGDCDDLDATRNPLARERTVGKDQNCNGIPLRANDSDADRGLAPAAGDPDLPKNALDTVLLVSIDCLRYDALAFDLMPEVARLSTEGVAFERAYSGGTRTHISFLLMQRGTDEAEPVAVRLQARGVHTSAVMPFDDPALSPSERAGFERVAAPADASWWDATRVTDVAIAALRASSGPTYLWVHYIDAHDPRRPVPADVPAFAGRYSDPLYPRELAWIDREVGRLFAELKAEDKQVLAIVTSDHGEGLGAHGVKYHGLTTYEDVVHIPVFMVGPGIAPGKYDGLVSHRDLPATVLGAFGLVADDPSIERFGRSWLRLRAAPRAPLHEFVVARSDRTVTLAGFVQPQAALVQGSLKLTRTFEDGVTELHDLARDPTELTDLDPASAEGAKLARELETYRDIDRYP
jgi:hypothetical protein